MKNLIVGVAAAAVLAAGTLVFTSVKVSARQPYMDVYFGCTGPVIPAYTVDGRIVGVCADRATYSCSAHCNKILEPDTIDDSNTAICPGDSDNSKIDDQTSKRID